MRQGRIVILLCREQQAEQMVGLGLRGVLAQNFAAQPARGFRIARRLRVPCLLEPFSEFPIPVVHGWRVVLRESGQRPAFRRFSPVLFSSGIPGYYMII